MTEQTVRELREDHARIVTNAQSKFDEITADTPEERAAEIEAEFDRMMEDVARLEGRIDRRLRLDAARARVDAPDDRRPTGVDGDARPDADETPTYRRAFHSYMRAQGQMGALTAEERAVLHGGFQQVEARALTTSPDTAGGYTVPEEMAETLIRSMKMWGPMYDENICTVIATSGGNPMPMPTIDDTGGTAGAHTEGASLTDDGGVDPTFGSKQLDAYAFDTEWIRVSLELASDSFLPLENLLGDLLGERMGRKANSELTIGTGSSSPHGVATAAGAGNTAAANNAITFDEIMDLEHTVDPAYRQSPKARYMFNDQTLLALRKLKDGDGNYLWQMGNVQAGVAPSLNGRPYSINQAMAGIGASARPILFGDFGKYFVRKVGSPLIGALQDKAFWPGFGVAGYIRFDGELGDTAAIKSLIMPA